MKRTLWISLLLACVPLGAQADHDTDWDDWYSGDVRVQLRVRRGEGSLYALGEPVGLRLEANEDAYHLVYAIDTEGYVRLLFPRPWEDDGWLEARDELALDAGVLAWPADRWGRSGIVYVEAVASPLPFDFDAMGLRLERGCSLWTMNGLPYRVDGDPFLAFNDVHRTLFPRWDDAVFAVDYTYFHVGAYYEAPRYLGYRYERVYVRPPSPRFSVGVRFGWTWDYGPRYCRPVYSSYYVPGRHVLYHSGHHQHHLVYGRSWREPTAPPRRVVHEPPVQRQRQPVVRERLRSTAPTRQRDAGVGGMTRRVSERQRERAERQAPERRAAEAPAPVTERLQTRQRSAAAAPAVSRRAETGGQAAATKSGARAAMARSKKESSR